MLVWLACAVVYVGLHPEFIPTLLVCVAAGFVARAIWDWWTGSVPTHRHPTFKARPPFPPGSPYCFACGHAPTLHLDDHAPCFCCSQTELVEAE